MLIAGIAFADLFTTPEGVLRADGGLAYVITGSSHSIPPHTATYWLSYPVVPVPMWAAPGPNIKPMQESVGDLDR